MEENHSVSFPGMEEAASSVQDVVSLVSSYPIISDEVRAAGVSFLAGCAGGAAQAIFGHPFDTVKVTMQVSETEVSTLGSVSKIFHEEGIRGFYRGLMAPLAGVAFFTAVEFSAYQYMKEVLGNRRATGEGPTYSDLALSGVFAGASLSLVLSPFELVKSHVQIQAVDGVEKVGSGKTLQNLVKQRGVSYVATTGLGATLMREMPGNMVYFTSYELLKRILARGDAAALASPSALTCIAAGGLAGCAFWTVSYPMDILKTRIQTAPQGRYAGLVDCAKHVFRKNGFTAFYRGFAPCFARAFPANAVTFLAYEWVLKLCSPTNL